MKSAIVNVCWLISLLTIGFITVVNAEEGGEALYSDGPYVTFDNAQLRFDWLCNNELKSRYFPVTALPIHFKQCQLAADVDRIKFPDNELVFNTVENIAAISDFHGQLELMISILTNNGIIDEQGHWTFGQGHFVITGDVFDRGNKVTEILWLLYRLEQEAKQAGGRVHLLLGNHEVMVLNADLRYLNEKYLNTAIKLNKPFEKLYGKNTLLGQWLRSKPVLVKINNMLFAHGGFHPDFAKEKHSLHEINQVFKANLVKAELSAPREGWGKYLHKRNGPIWYRGYFNVLGASDEEVELLLQHFSVDYLVVGHTSQQQIETRYQGRVIAIDSSIKNGLYGEILLVENGKQYRGLPNGDKHVLSVVD
jgi:hypothetical protein